MPTVVNGRELGVARNGNFDADNTDPIYEGKLWTEAAASWNAMRAAAIADGIPAWEFAPAGPNSSARTIAAQQYFWANQPPPAAFPGTSNHGWGIAVDVKTRRAAAWIYSNGHRYGWSWDEGRRVGEWWHLRYIGGFRPVDPFAVLDPDERKWARELEEIRDHIRKHPSWSTHPNRKARAEALKRVLIKHRKHIWRVSQKAGWDKNRRRERYRVLMALTT